MRIEVQWFVSALKDNQLISPADAAALDRELGGDAELGTFAQTFVERKAAGLDPEQTAQWVESIQQLIDFAVAQAETGAAPDLELPQEAPPAAEPAPAPVDRIAGKYRFIALFMGTRLAGLRRAVKHAIYAEKHPGVDIYVDMDALSFM